MDAEGENEQLIVSFVNKFMNQCSPILKYFFTSSKTKIEEIKALMEYNMNNYLETSLTKDKLNRLINVLNNNKKCDTFNIYGSIISDCNKIWSDFTNIFNGYESIM